MPKITKSSASTWVTEEHHKGQIDGTEPWPRDPILHPLLDDKSLATITRYGSVQRVAPGRILVTQGYPTTTFVVVLEGAIAVDSRTGGGVERMHVHGKGGFVGDIQILTGRLSFYSVHALQPSKVVLLDRTATRRLLDCEAEMGELIMRALLPYWPTSFRLALDVGSQAVPLETSLPGVFAVGDIRANSIKRVAAGVGEGSMSATFIHRVLES